MKYVCLIYVRSDFDPSAAESTAVMAEYDALTEDMKNSGAYVEALRLGRPYTATTLRLRDDQRLLSDGPFAEAKEVLAGFYLIECAHLDEALDYAKRIPAARHGAIEVRPLVED